MRLFRTTPASIACLLAVGCSTPSATAPTGTTAATAATVAPGSPTDWKLASATLARGNNFQASAPPNQVSVLITGGNISGANFNLAVGKDFVRGQGTGAVPINVVISGNRADGSSGGKKFSLVLEPQADGSAHVTGLMGMGMSDFVLSPKALTGRIGMITYDLAWNGSRYQGIITPGGTAYIEFPAVMAGWSDIQTLTVLCLFLTR
jgi:hypothetical protein